MTNLYTIIPTTETTKPPLYDELKKLSKEIIISKDINQNSSMTRNQGIKKILKKLKCDDVVLFCDDDITIIPIENSKYTIKAMLSLFENYPKSAVSPCILNKDLTTIYSTDIKETPHRCFNHKNRTYDYAFHSYFKTDCEALSTGFLMVSASAFLIDNIFFDEKFNNSQFEDVDFTMQLRKAGYNLIYIGTKTVIHDSKSSRDNKQKYKDSLKNHKYLCEKWA